MRKERKSPSRRVGVFFARHSLPRGTEGSIAKNMTKGPKQRTVNNDQLINNKSEIKNSLSAGDSYYIFIKFIFYILTSFYMYTILLDRKLSIYGYTI